MKRRSRSKDVMGDSLTALCGGALAVNLVLVVGLLLLLAVNGLGTFWQKDLVLLTLDDGEVVLGEIHDREAVPSEDPTAPVRHRIQIKTGNRDLAGLDFRWIDEDRIAGREFPADAVVLERLEWGNFHGRLVELRRDGALIASGTGAVWASFEPLSCLPSFFRAFVIVSCTKTQQSQTSA